MSQIISSTVTVAADGWVREVHRVDDGAELVYVYPVSPDIDPDQVMSARAATINTELAAQAAWMVSSLGGGLGLIINRRRRRR